MNLNIALILVIAVSVTGAITLLDLLWLKSRRTASQRMPLWIEYARSFFPILLIVLVVRSFLFEPFRIPSGSLKPTLAVGDFILVNKYHYGLRLPVVHTTVLTLAHPKRGDIVVFRWPADTRFDYIKRVIGLPGDHIQYQHKRLTINGHIAPQTFHSYTTDSDGAEQGSWVVEKRMEQLGGVKHAIYLRPDVPSEAFDVKVPPGYYFMMGDNRDDSADSRFWGFVPENNLIGKAVIILLSWDGTRFNLRWSRIGQRIH